MYPPHMIRALIVIPILAATLAFPESAHAEVPSVPVGPRVEPSATPPNDLYVRERERYMDGRRVFLSSLLAWGGTSIAAGVPLVAIPRDPFVQWYGVQTIAWGAVNAGIAVVGLLTTSGVRAELRDRDAVFAERRSIRRFLLVNVALDALYVATGALMLGLGTDPSLRGNGAAILTQGAFLLGFDALGTFTQGPVAPLSL